MEIHQNKTSNKYYSIRIEAAAVAAAVAAAARNSIKHHS
jgi:hypothetical protein